MVVNLSLKFEYEEKVIGSINSHHKLICEDIYSKCQKNINAKQSLPYSFDIMTDPNLLNSVHDLKPILKSLGIKADLCFKHYSQISVTILDFI